MGYWKCQDSLEQEHIEQGNLFIKFNGQKIQNGAYVTLIFINE